MRRRARIDGNHAQVVSVLRRGGATVFSTAGVGDGFPDLVVGYRGVTHLIEVKNGTLTPSRQRLTDDEQDWHHMWLGEPVEIVRSESQAAHLIWYWSSG